MFSLLVLSAVARLERALIAERTKLGLEAAKALGRIASGVILREGEIVLAVSGYQATTSSISDYPLAHGKIPRASACSLVRWLYLGL